MSRAKKPQEQEIEEGPGDDEVLEDDEEPWDDDVGLEAPQEFDEVLLLRAVRLGTKMVDGTIAPAKREEYQDIRLYDAGKFLEMRQGSVRRWIPWMHVGYVTPAAE